MNGINIRGKNSAIGDVYQDGEVIIRQGDVGDCMYVIQEGQVEVVVEQGGQNVLLAVREAGQPFGEMAIFERQPSFATVRALGRTRVLPVDKRSFLCQMHKDPTLAYHMVQTMSRRVRELSAEVARRQHQYPSAKESRYFNTQSATTAPHATANGHN